MTVLSALWFDGAINQFRPPSSLHLSIKQENLISKLKYPLWKLQTVHPIEVKEHSWIMAIPYCFQNQNRNPY